MKEDRAVTPRPLADIRRDIEALDFSPYDSIEAAPQELSDRLVDLSDELTFALNREHVTAPIVAHLGAVTG